jgi:GrpB-like predicted nucleotidyltransferase (UPF0157 family)
MEPIGQSVCSSEMLTIKVVPYEPSWSEHFQRIRSQLENVLTDVPIIAIEHIGSTSVPGLAAKPIIDIDIIVSPTWFPSAASVLSFNGYTYHPEPPYMDRMSFRYNAHIHDSGASKASEDGDIRRAVYLNMPCSSQLRKHILSRYILRNNEGLRKEYGDLKLHLSRRKHESIGHYGTAKSSILRTILEKGERDERARDELDGLCA